ncbi:PaaI family thioesterase [Nocardia terpenica]|uniref:Aromatic compound degradation protein PaaI n=1 Tax=Nocardia terpenica TaxID=455432 RepID=A0A291RS73_9NOCA|nr:PaaI family thioesterase [Nocardia terpenica]ATL70084.1 aromatic compound degradation protein PaaI [Nocardia terpenica]
MTTETTAAPHTWGTPRSKTVTWYDPVATARVGATMSGLEYLRAVAEGELPNAPISATLGGMTAFTVSEGEVAFTCVPDESVYNPIGTVHGGVVCTLLDSAVGCAVHTLLPPGVGYSSVELKVSYLRPIHASTGPVHVRGWVTKPGRRIAFAEGDVRDSGGKLLATASSSLLVFPYSE